MGPLRGQITRQVGWGRRRRQRLLSAAAGFALLPWPAQAATGADYWLTRSQAVEALGGVGAAALPALERALRDTSAQVRRSAVAALGEVGVPDAPFPDPDVHAALIEAADT